MAPQTLYTLIGDVVGSRGLADRASGQERLGRALAEVSEVLGPAQPLEATVGDEFQGAFSDLPSAALAALLVRLAVLPDVDVRCGLGHGEVTVYDAARRPLLQDGPGWWAARDALDAMSSTRRTAYQGPGAGRVNAFLLCRDALVDRFSDRGRRMLAMSLTGATQQQISEVEGITKSAVSQQFSRGIAAVRDAQRLFAGEE